MTGAGWTDGGGGAGVAGASARDEHVADEQEQQPVEARPDALAAAEQQRDEYLDALQRLKAEFDNYRKRVAREQQELVARASERLVAQLVPILDDLERALEAAAQHEEARLEDGVRLVHRALADALAKEGLSEIATDGRFDPHTQEALLSQPSHAEEGAVLQVLQKGYRLGDRVLRPARVVVSAGAPQQEEAEPAEEAEEAPQPDA
ncbi:MAG TPA: nucleotide exchange factor GrpE [Gaiellaceae bacterium]|nr:nucleotide exchange factor GrpE [Gaiellaceae bacterium]